MARVNTLLFLVTVALTVVAAIDCLAADRVRHFPRGAWLLLVACCPVAGPIAWFRAGRGDTAPAGRPATGTAPLGPEDDPEFVRMLAEAIRDR
ncbi:PLD nuclease N-terminal domain-containing protein [Actinoplanes teichomyceticus]|uniref:Phospholipase D-like protein n=1 Tax=Actinoplanes teichomyceticus TaxID=1867 RepID=A0A561VS62_ACTTI|nr:PLD nuclease N-terminal domain-containing protein [Actinoplanes teichomyceticus]TWG14428.1 phospholipase D-like protein [Actinoplanes teichomyceticus]GIF16229.1 hypothetical protein Ate01nite_62610 [Actinoplanes teichomyceticus]